MDHVASLQETTKGLFPEVLGVRYGRFLRRIGSV